MQWSKPFDAMSCTSSLAIIATASGVQAHVAVSACQVCLLDLSPLFISLRQVSSVGISAAQETSGQFTVYRASHGHVRQAADVCGSPSIMEELGEKFVALQVRGTWHVVLRKGHRIVNKTVQQLDVLTGFASGVSADTAEQAEPMIIQPDEVSCVWELE